MFPLPNKIIGGRKELLKSYINQIKTSKTKVLPIKAPGVFRFCSYNIKYFKFEKYDSNNINSFINTINPDAFSLIEYDTKNDEIFKISFPYKSSVLFEQLPQYGILTMYNSKNADAISNISKVKKTYESKYSLYILKKMQCLSHNRYGKLKEFRGFTHMVVTHNNQNINIITIHLDVYDETGTIRLKEIT